MKASYIVRIVAGLVIAAVLLVILVMGIRGGFSFGGLQLGGFQLGGMRYAHADEYTPGPGQWDGERVRQMKIDWIGGRVKVERGTDQTLSLREQSKNQLEEKDQMHWWLDGDTLRVQPCRSSLWSVGRRPSKTLIVTLPQDWTGQEVHIEAVSAAIEGDGFAAQDISLETVSGEIVLEGVQCDELDVETVSGAIVLTDLQCRQIGVETVSGEAEIAGAMEHIDAETVSGEILFASDPQPKSVSMETVSGDMTLELPASAQFVAELEAVSGRIYESFGDTDGRERVYVGRGGPTYSFESVSGDALVRPAA